MSARDGILKFAAIVGGAKLILSWVSLRNVRPIGTRRLDDVSDLIYKHWSVGDLEMKAGRVLDVRIAVSRKRCGFHIKIHCWGKSNFRCRCRSRVEGFMRRAEQIAHGVVQGLDDVGRAVFLIAVEVQAGKLTDFHKDFAVAKRLLKPPRIQSPSMSADQTAGICNSSNFCSQVGAELPHTSRMECKPLCTDRSPQVSVDRPAKPSPPRPGLLLSSPRISFEIRNVIKLEGHSHFRQASSFAVPIAKQIPPSEERIGSATPLFVCRNFLRRGGRSKEDKQEK